MALQQQQASAVRGEAMPNGSTPRGACQRCGGQCLALTVVVWLRKVQPSMYLRRTSPLTRPGGRPLAARRKRVCALH